MKSFSLARGRVAASMAFVLLLIAILLVAPSGPDAAAAGTAEKIKDLQQEQRQLRGREEQLAAEREQVKAERKRIGAQLQDITARLGTLEAELAVVTERVKESAAAVEDITDQLERHEARAKIRVRELYKSGASDPVLLLLTGTSTEELSDRSHYLSAVSENDRSLLEALAATSVRRDRRTRDLEKDRAALSQLEKELEAANAELTAEMEKAVAADERLAMLLEETVAERTELADEERALRAKQAAAARAQRTPRFSGAGASVAVTSGGKACPQAQPRSFTDTWGAPRSGGRRHQGTDIMGARGGNVYAITSGTIQFTKVGGTAGLFLSLRGDDGNVYWYMHLQDFSVGAGQRVRAGQVIGHNGDTGNARGTTPHIHFELHPGGGGATNPYPLLRSVCG